MAQKKAAPKQKSNPFTAKSTLKKPAVTPPGKKVAPTTPVQVAPVRMKKGSRGC